MQGIQRTDEEVSSMFTAAKRMACRYGRIGLYEPDDICQVAMLKLLKKNDGRPGTTAWLVKVVHTAAMDAGRGTAKDARAILRGSDSCIVSPPDVEIDLMPHLKNMLGKLSRSLRQVLVLYAEGYSYKEIAVMTNSHIGTVRSRLHHARKKAKDILGDLA
jgi:RNA polymerase sigma factor (sigma-70 family)